MLTESSDFDIRYTAEGDKSFLEKWMGDPQVIKWFPGSTLADVGPLMTNWIMYSRYKSSLTAEYKGEPIGIGTLFLMPYRKVAHFSMLYIVVDPKFQKQGVGTALLKNLKHLAKTRFRLEAIQLETYGGCPADKALKKADFKEVFRQENFAQIDGEPRCRTMWEVKL